VAIADDRTAYGCGLWQVRPDCVDEFLERWRELARRSLDAYPGIGPARLWQDRDDPSRFVSFIPWKDFEQIERFLADAEFSTLWGGLMDLLASGDRRLMTLREVIGEGDKERGS
jgi:heme-degrading monooxygenase HmoA